VRMGTVVLAMVVALPATSTFAQTRTPSSSAAKQDVGDPLVQRRTSEEKVAGVTRGQARHVAPKLKQGIGGPPSSQQDGTDNGG